MPPKKILGEHPSPDEFGCHTIAEDGQTNSNTPHRSLIQDDQGRNATILQIREALVQHHVSTGMIERDKRKIKNLIAQGYPVSEVYVHRFPKSDKTRKGNLTEVFLAEYICSSSDAVLPVYRLRYNPNVEQSMKGDDVLIFDFSSKRPRIIVCEAKFRGTPSKKAVQDIVEGLIRSYKAGLPASLQFVSDRLYEANNIELADQVSDCALHMANGNLDLNYVGLLLSNHNSKSNVNQHTEGNLRNLVMISLGIVEPSLLVQESFDGIEEKVYGNPE
jgi:hypothetical protein